MSTPTLEKSDLVELRQALLATDTVQRWVLREGCGLRDVDLVVANTQKNHLRMAPKDRLRRVLKKLAEDNPDQTEAEAIRGALELLPGELADETERILDELREAGWTKDELSKLDPAELLKRALERLS